MIVRPFPLATARFVGKVSSFFQVVNWPGADAASRDAGIFHRGLTGGAVERDDLSGSLASQAARVPIANLTGHFDRSNPRSLHAS